MWCCDSWYIWVWCAGDILWLMWTFTDPPDTSFDEKLFSLSIQSPQMKSYIKRFWRGCVSSTLKMTNTDTQRFSANFSSRLYLLLLNHSSHTLPNTAEQRSLWWCKSRPALESLYQFCLFLVILLNLENWSIHWAEGCSCYLVLIVSSSKPCHTTLLFTYQSWAVMWVRVTYSSCSVCLGCHVIFTVDI